MFLVFVYLQYSGKVHTGDIQGKTDSTCRKQGTI